MRTGGKRSINPIRKIWPRSWRGLYSREVPTDRVKRERRVGPIVKEIEAVQQPVELLSGQAHGAVHAPPAEALLLQPFVPDDEAVALPAQQLDLVAPAIAEHKDGVQTG